MRQYNRVCAKINLDAITHNMNQMKKHIGDNAQIMAVVKAGGYGHGSVPIARHLETEEYIWGFAVASLEEALVLRNAGIKKTILVLGCIFPDQYEEMMEYDICPTIYFSEMAENMNRAAVRMGKMLHAHIKLDTGMGRLGFAVNQENARIVADIYRMSNITVTGLFTHFAKSDETDPAYTNWQYDEYIRFYHMLVELGIIDENGKGIPYYHCNNSAGIIAFPQFSHNLVRAGISTYGMYPSDEVDVTKILLKPALELTSHVAFVKEIAAGTAVSYGGTFVAPTAMKIAVIPVGYGDGYPRSLSGKGAVLIRGRRCPILGRVCMDQFMVDVSDLDEVKFMDQVVLIGRSGKEQITVDELSRLSNRFNYEFVCCLGSRIPRIYTKNDVAIDWIDILS